MKAQIKILVWSIIIFALNYAYLLWPESKEVFSFFKYNAQLLSKQVYVDYICRILVIVIFYCILISLKKEIKGTVFFICILWVLFLADFFITYNQPIGWWHFIPISYSALMGLVLLVVLIYKMKIYVSRSNSSSKYRS